MSRGSKAVPDRHVPQRPHDVGEIDLLRAAGIAPVAHHAQPDRRRLQHFFAHAEKDLADDGPAVVVFVDIRDRASRRAGAAGKHFLILPPPGIERHFIAKAGIEIFDDDNV